MTPIQTLVALLLVTNVPLSRAAIAFDRRGLTAEELVETAASVDPRRCTNQNRGDTGDGEEDTSKWKLRGCVNAVIDCCQIAARRGWVSYSAEADKKACPNTRMACYAGPTPEDTDGN